ncbi:MAG: peptidoglycan-binding protein LysM [Bacteroidales bacterium]|nr:peptidoglycan-binding protein LysM [Bacteroidales bacterium]MDT8373744.1 peptidoglycan-binding protein LysM [Bacteroidales bacterium]
MGLISFIKNAGTKIFKSEDKREEEKAEMIAEHIKKFGFDVSKVKVAVDDERVILTGQVDTWANKNKIIVTAGNVDGISAVEDHLLVMTPEPVAPPEPEKQFYTVKKGDYLSKIAKQVYGDARKYPVIFEANKPMLKDPDLIYPGQVLVIPPLQ